MAARGAYQAGALVELLPALAAEGRRPTILTGASVGALNATAVAATAHLPVDEQVGALVALWEQVRERDVLRPFALRVPQVLLRYATELSPFPGPRLRGMIDMGPLRRTVERVVDWDQLEANVGADGPVATLMVMATQVVSGQATAFVVGGCPPASGDRVRYVPTRLGADHLVASASIPLLFEATRIDEPEEAAGWYCDGSTRLSRPVTPCCDAGADDLVVVSTTSLDIAEAHPEAPEQEPDLADVAVNVLEALVRDVLVDDLDRCRRLHDVRLPRRRCRGPPRAGCTGPRGDGRSAPAPDGSAALRPAPHRLGPRVREPPPGRAALLPAVRPGLRGPCHGAGVG